MSYQALYRKYRPQRFEDISGQRALTQTLRHAIQNNMTSHAYLFTGPRGTGKTSAAKIFAKAINCPNQVDGEPCNQCEICEAITKGSLNDVIEIDAASNNGVDEIRDIREKANYAPTRAKYKLYIIDEVHMLSQGAFNALLKTLEEPPANVIFILATTEPHKIPLTIISRTQRFDFKPLSQQDIIERMQYVLNAEDIDYEEDALAVISRAASGGMRDGLSILDQAIVFSNGKISTETAMEITGSLTQHTLIEYYSAMANHQTEQALNTLQDILSEGKAPDRLAEDMIIFSRDILVYKEAPDQGALLQRASESEDFTALCQSVENDFIYRVIQIFNEAQHDLSKSNHAPVYLEVATVRISQASEPKAVAVTQTQSAPNKVDKTESNDVLQGEIDSLKKAIKDLQSYASSNQQTQQPSKPQTKKPKKNKGIKFEPNRNEIYEVLNKATREDLNDAIDVWPDLLNYLDVTDRALLNASEPVAASPSGIVVAFQYEILAKQASENEILQEKIGDYTEKVSGKRRNMAFITKELWPNLRTNYYETIYNKDDDTNQSQVVEEEKQKEVDEQASVDDLVEPVVNLFGKENVNLIDD